MLQFNNWYFLTLLILFPFSILPGVTISYDNLGTFTSSSYLTSGVEVAGTGDLYFLNANGIGIVGGTDTIRVDPATAIFDESLDFYFDSPDSFASFTPTFSSSSNLDGGGIDSFTVEAFGPFENFIGSFNYSGTGISLSGDDVITRLSLTSASMVRIIASGDAYLLQSIEFTPTSAIPEPETYGAILGALALVGVIFRRLRNKSTGPGCR